MCFLPCFLSFLFPCIFYVAVMQFIVYRLCVLLSSTACLDKLGMLEHITPILVRYKGWKQVHCGVSTVTFSGRLIGQLVYVSTEEALVWKWLQVIKRSNVPLLFLWRWRSLWTWRLLSPGRYFLWITVWIFCCLPETTDMLFEET